MKIRLLPSLLLLGSSALTTIAAEKTVSPPTASPTGQAADAPEWDKRFRGVALPTIWHNTLAALARIEAGIPARNYPDIAAQAETIHLAAHALEDQVKLGDVERQKRLRGALSQASKIADDVIDAAEHKEPEKLDEAFRRLSAALRLSALRLPKEITSAAK